MPPREAPSVVDIKEYLAEQERAANRPPLTAEELRGPMGRRPGVEPSYALNSPYANIRTLPPKDAFIYERWLGDEGQQSLVQDGDRSPNSPVFLAFKADRGPNGEWLSPEQLYQKRQFETLQNEEKLNQELQPFILESMGLRYGADGKLEKIPPAALTPEQQAEKDLEDLYKEHLTAAQEGRLPVDLATQRTLDLQEEGMGEAMSRKGGRFWREGTPGIKQQGNFMLTSEATKEASRHGDYNTAAGLLNQRQASISDLTQRRLGGLEGAGGPTYSLVNSYGNAQNPYLFQGLLNTRMANQESANKAADTAGKYGLLAAGAGLGVYAGYKYYNQPKTTTK